MHLELKRERERESERGKLPPLLFRVTFACGEREEKLQSNASAMLCNARSAAVAAAAAAEAATFGSSFVAPAAAKCIGLQRCYSQRIKGAH